MEKSGRNKHRHVVAMPYPGRGHINPMLNLCKLLLLKSNNNLIITFVVTEEWLGFLSAEAHEPPPPNFRMASLPQVIPSEIGRGSDFPAFVEAVSTKLQEPFERLLDGLEPAPSVIVYDMILGWVVEVGNERNIAVATLVTFSSSFLSILSNFDLLVQHRHFPLDISERGDEIVDYIPGLPPTKLVDFPSIFQGDGRKVLNTVLKSVSSINNTQFILSTSIYEFEPQVVNFLTPNFTPPLYNIGPMIPYFNLPKQRQPSSSNDYFQWLDSQPKNSVLYISQGSFLSASNDQIHEIIEGIKLSNVPFLWVTRGDTQRFKDAGISDKIGCLVSWCDQLKVLCHPSIGGFWTHCGWNSTAEAMYAGVPVLTCPIFWDQFPNSKFLVEDLRIGWRVLKNGDTKTREEIAQIVRKFMDSENEERKEMVRRAQEVRDTFHKAIANGGSAASDLDTFVNKILSI
ncbi:unnamed protein product [Amaranthus hypochondriacus]